MKCGKCEEDMFKAELRGHYNRVWLRNKEPGLTGIHKTGTVSCHVCPACGYIELYADDPKRLILK